MKLKYKLRSFWENFKLRCRVMWAAVKAPWQGDVTPVGRLYISKISNGQVEDFGLVSTKVVTTAGVNYLVDAMQGIVEPENLRWHASGTDNTSETIGQTALGVEVATRVQGTLAEGSSANIYRTVATIPYTGTHAIVEHAILSANSAGTMLDRSVFAAINVGNGDSIQFTYELTFPAGS
jgi:hypothetical protein